MTQQSEEDDTYWCTQCPGGCGADILGGGTCVECQLRDFPLVRLEYILVFLRSQARQRAQENDLAGVLEGAAQYIETDAAEVEPLWKQHGY